MNLRPWLSLVMFGAVLVGVAARAEKIVLVAGGSEDRVDLPAERARLIEPFGADFDRAGRMFIVEMVTGNRLLMVARRWRRVSTVRITSPFCPMATC